MPIPAALVRIPGTPSSAAYTEDSYLLAKKGMAELVLGVDVICSAIGGIMGAIALMIAATALAEVAIYFTSFEYFWLGALGLSATTMVGSTSIVKCALSILFGLFLSTVGLDITLGYPRFTFGSVELMNGVNFIPAMIGLFGISEVIRNVTAPQLPFEITKVNHRQIFRGVWGVISKYRWNILRSGGIGTFIGILPGAGADVAAWLAYGVSRRFSKTPEEFGKGHMEPVVDAGTANNACLAGDWVPALVFGIPGDAINNTFFDIGVMLVMGIAGYLFEANGFPVAPVVLGLVLGPIVEQNFMISMIKTQWDLTQFFGRPASAILAVLTILTWVAPLSPILFRRFARSPSDA